MSDAPAAPPIYALRGFTHGWAPSLTLMSGDGATALRRRIRPGDDLIVRAAPGCLLQLLEKRDGAFARLIRTHAVQVLKKGEWDQRKSALGPDIYR